MEHEITKISPWRRHRVWLIPLVILIALFYIFNSMSNNAINRYGAAYTNNHLYEKAYDLARNHPEVVEVFGDKFRKHSIGFGEVVLNEDETEMLVTLKVEGTKGKGMMHVWAKRSGQIWKNQTIKVMTKFEPIKVIEILK